MDFTMDFLLRVLGAGVLKDSPLFCFPTCWFQTQTGSLKLRYFISLLLFLVTVGICQLKEVFT